MSLRAWSKGGREGISHFAESWPRDAPGFALCDRKLLLKCLEDSVERSGSSLGTKYWYEDKGISLVQTSIVEHSKSGRQRRGEVGESDRHGSHTDGQAH